LGYSSWMQLKDIIPSYTVAIIIASSVYFLKYLPLCFWIILPLQLLIGGGVFFVICESRKMCEYIEVKSIAMGFVNKLTSKKRH